MWYFINQDSSFTLDDSDYSIIGRDQPSTCEYLMKSNKKVDGWIEISELSKLDDKRGSISADYTIIKEHQMLNCILGIDYETQNVASDSKNYDRENNLNVFGSVDYIDNYSEEHGSHDPHNNCDSILQKDVPPLTTNNNSAHENSVVCTQNNDLINLTLMGNDSAPALPEISCAISSPCIHDDTITSQNGTDNTTNGKNEEMMEAPTSVTHTMPSTDHSGYFHHRIAVIEGDYGDYAAIGEHSENLQNDNQPVCPMPLEGFEDGSCHNTTQDINVTLQFQSIIDSGKVVPPTFNDDSSEVKEGAYIDIDSGTTVHQGTGQDVFLDKDQMYYIE